MGFFHQSCSNYKVGKSNNTHERKRMRNAAFFCWKTNEPKSCWVDCHTLLAKKCMCAGVCIVYLWHLNCPPPVCIPPLDLCAASQSRKIFPCVNFPYTRMKIEYTQNSLCIQNGNKTDTSNESKMHISLCVSRIIIIKQKEYYANVCQNAWVYSITFFCTISTDCGCLVTVMDSQRYFCYCAVRFPLLLLNLLTHFFYCITWNSILFVLVHFKPQSNLFLSCIRHKIRFVVSFHIVSFSHFYHFGEWCSCPHKCILCILFQIIFVLCFHFLTPFHPTLLPMLLCQVSEPYEYTLLQIVHTRVFFSLLFLSDKVTKPPRLHVHTPYRSKQHFNQFPYSIFRSNEMWMVKSAPASAAAVAYAF